MTKKMDEDCPGESSSGPWFNTGPIVLTQGQKPWWCAITSDPINCGGKATSGTQPQDTKLAALKYKHQTTALLIALAVVISIYVYNNR